MLPCRLRAVRPDGNPRGAALSYAPSECAALDQQSVRSKDTGRALGIESEHDIGLVLGTVHARGADRHTRNRKALDRETFREDPLYVRGRDMAFDQISADIGRMARCQIDQKLALEAASN